MTDERTDLERRAAKHAALGDPARLRMLDLLTLGDRSPSELQAVLGMPSNLLAHHLGVLEREGIVRRSRSEGDRRRSYVTLAPGALADLGPSATAAARRVVFVCTANSARSQLAEALWHRASDVPAVSAGTHPAPRIARGAVAAAERHGLALNGHPRAFAEIADDADFVITVCDNAHEELGIHGLHWSVPDPVAEGSARAFDAAYDELARRVDALAPRIVTA
ncbi:helix-turn-helix domain-containing protein [Galbitalea sp. SE-J8]|uniref:arsenate reductase/protein-tyrosine-phosphatase family protein n=1 Tax=Galbitalea sp. SE-J8 TaxID=3054952 RepID=UPI00259D2537|nr:helix-turn-helix domain-containing protein [Galbitalea sp. SE-J8]MDM4761675.1 helix-turn-helix domain-containing protein [Galbitalea sp. SE-J8]